MRTPSISIIIPAHQEESQIAETLDCLTTQTYPHFEAIVVANGCTDRTVPIAQGYATRLPLRIIETDARGIGYACNRGAEQAHQDIILILEADTVLPPTGLEEVAKAIEEGYAGGTIKMAPKENRLLFRIGCKFIEWQDGANWGPVRFCTREIYERIGGHREDHDFGVDGEFKSKVELYGKSKYITSINHKTSMRRVEKDPLDMLAQTKDFLLGWYLGIPSDRIDHPVVR